MRLDHPDYIKLVIAAYNKKRANKELSPLLAKSTPASIRKECLHVYRERYDKKDEQVLRAFFGPPEPGRQFLQIIEGFPTNKFKPLDNRLKGDTGNTDDINLELLAWLIDFQYRPYVFDMEVILTKDELATIGKSEKNPGNDQTKYGLQKYTLKEEDEGVDTDFKSSKLSLNIEVGNAEDDTKKQKKKRRRIIIIILIVSACLGGSYFIWQQERSKQTAFGNATTGCMYWKDDHYEAMPCNEERKDRLKLPLDPEKMKSFKRILREDTITEKSIGKVYYIKIDGRIEYYTSGGNHPIDVTRTLRPLSIYMFEKYLNKKNNGSKSSTAERNRTFINNY